MAHYIQRPKNMALAVFASTNTTSTPRSFAAAHPGYGPNALAAADERLADELASTRRYAATTTTASEHALSITEIDRRLEDARRTIVAAKAAYEAALGAEKGLKAQREVAVRREEKLKGLRGAKEEKMKRRDRALAAKKTAPGVAGVKPAGIRKAVVSRKGKV